MRQLQLVVTGNTVNRLDVTGFLFSVFLVYTNGHTSGTDVVLFRQLPNGIEDTLLTVTNSNSNLNYPLRVQGKDSAGAAISGVYGYPALAGELAIRVSGGDAAGILTAYFVVLDDDARSGRY
jgi:hypothetical protein